MGLKTLKDLEEIHTCSESDFAYINQEELKAEAVKWVKDGQCVEVYEFIMEFFNITEEDLKN